jgi:uncharacterized protein DUF1206
MQSLSSPRVMGSARRASNSPAAHFLARAGLVARGAIYILVGWVAVLVALGQSSRQPDQQGALQMLAGKSYGIFFLWLLGIGFAGYALWRLSEAAFGVSGEPGTGPRLKSLARAVIYAFLSYLTFSVINGKAGSQSGKQQDMTASMMHHPWGRVLVGIVGLIVLICGIVLVIEGARKKFMKHLQTAQMSAKTRKGVKVLGMTGTIARGVVFGLVGIGIIAAAVTHKASESGGIDKALLTLRNQPFGEFLMLLVALGLVIFGIYGLCEARWRRV